MDKKNLIISKLREKDVKVTPQRIAIIDYLEKNKDHPTADEIYKNVSRIYPTISLATIYNTLEKLEEINEVIKLKINDDNVVNYEYFNNPHHHFYCNNCKKIYDINVQCEFSKSKNIEGHQIEEIHGYFKGLCKNCIEKNKI